MKTKLLKLLAVMTISITALFALGITASAATAGDFTITLTEGVGDPVVDIDYTYADGVLTILSDKDITIKNIDTQTPTTNRIEVADGVSANITLAGVNIDVSGTEYAAAFKIADNSAGNVTITIADGTTNTLKSGKYCAGLQKNGAYISETQGKLTITGTCSLTAPGGNSGSNITISGGTVEAQGGAGIGGGISRSTITAIGGEKGAGIGGGNSGSGSNITITISGGTVTATGGKCGAGIGGCIGGSGSYITISDGTVTATGGDYGAGIGGGYNGGNGSNIEISGGTVTATGGDHGAGIGGGWYGSGSNIEISGGSVKAVAGINANAIGGGNGQSAVTPTDGNGNNVYLLELTSATSSLKIDGKDFPINHGSDGKVYVYLPEGEHTVISDGNSATSKYAKNADNKLEPVGTAFTITGTALVYGTDYTYTDGVLTILSPKAVTIANTTPSTSTTDKIVVADGVSANITLAGVNIDVSTLDETAAFKIADNSAGNVTITLADGTTNTLKSGVSCAGLQKNGAGEGIGMLTICGTGSLSAQGGTNGGAGIGGGYDGSGSNITISGGVVIANGGGGAYGGAGIGGGGCDGSNIEISGGTVTATGGASGAGIGGGYNGSGSYITISGGEVTATGGSYGAGIGGGDSYGVQSVGCNIKISGGTVTATGGEEAAGIGGGSIGSGSNIKISGGSVKAVAGTVYQNCVPAAIGQGVQYDDNTGVYSNGAEVTPTDGTANATPVYLLGLDVDGTSAVTINGKAYPTKHIDENWLYVYLPAGIYTVANGNSQKIYTIADNGTVSEVAVGTAFTITGTALVYGTDYTYPADTGVLTILSGKAMTIANVNPNTATTNRIEVAGGVSANITLAGVNIDVSGTEYAAAFQIADNSIGNVTITLADGTTNTLKSGLGCAGLQKNGAYISETQGKLTITGTGSLTATGGDYYGAGIGGGDGGSGSNITISGGTITARGGGSGAGIGGGSGGSGSNIEISGGTVTATGGKGGAGIGGGQYGSTDNITISGGSVKAVAGTVYHNCVPAAIGQGVQYDGVYSNGAEVTPTDGNGNNVYLLGLDVDGTSAVTINGKAYPTKHFDENKVYIYLPAKTAQAPNEVTVGNETTKYCYINAKWLKVVDSPEADDTEFTYDGTEKTYTLAESDYYTITGNKQTNAGTYTVTVALKDGYIWNDGETDDKTFTFTIAKATVTVTAKSYTIKVGEALPTYAYDVAGLVNGETLPIDVTISCASDGKTAGAFDIVVSGAAASDNYTFAFVNGTLTVSEKEVVAAPTFTPASGTTFTSSQKVTISCATAGAKIYYTTDSTEPTTASTLYNGAFTITTTTTIKAIAVKDGMTDSAVVTAKYTKNSGGSGGSGGGSGGGGGYRPPVVPDDDDDDNDDVVVNDPEDNEDKPDNGNEPQIKGDNGNTGWDAILDELDDADEGDKIVVDMNGETEVPEDVFEQIKGQDIDLVIELDNGFIWTINGKDVTNPADIDLGVNKGSTIPVRVINAVTGECEYITITLTHNGEFGFKAVLTVDMGVKNEGYFANLYWYTDNDTKFICADKIDNKGRANLVFTHASEYVIVIDENDHTPEDDVSAGAGIEEDSSEIPDDFDNDENPYTGVAISFAGIIISAATIMIARKRKKQ